MKTIKSNILKLNMHTVHEVRKVFNLDKPGMMDQAVDTLYDWIQKQEHFVKKDFFREYLEAIIISTKGSIEKAKKVIDKVCTMRTMVPNLFEKCNAKTDFPNLKTAYINLSMPKMSDDHLRIFIAKLYGKQLSPAVLLEGYKFSVLLSEYIKLFDYSLGLHVICDLTEVNILDMVTKIDLVDLRNIMTLYTDGYGFRIKSIHVLSNSTMVGAFVDILKQMVSAKLAQRITVCKTIESLHACVPKHLLPEDYQGDQKSISTLYDDWLEELSRDDCIQYLQEMRGACTNEKLRRTDKFNDDYLGMPGSFKMLSVD